VSNASEQVAIDIKLLLRCAIIAHELRELTLSELRLGETFDVTVDLHGWDSIPTAVEVDRLRCLIKSVKNQGGMTILGWRPCELLCTYQCEVIR
jgi:hypothetical protein